MDTRGTGSSRMNTRMASIAAILDVDSLTCPFGLVSIQHALAACAYSHLFPELDTQAHAGHGGGDLSL